MYLKEIRTHGFKSFADKIEIEMKDGITCIVGPNGSGKSNVVDAVRWVLGEQSVKSLRGDGNMTDVIFSGSKSRKPVNIASVTLVFDNSDNYLKMPNTEVSLTRRVYRDGTNEYFINNERCRLKDVSDLLLDTGIAKESFNIISQGKIEEILNSKPNERRVIFEEAAGVLKYKKRKEDALRKLDKTNDNIKRIDDIIGELKNQVEPLEKQKDKALEYLDIASKLENLEVSLLASDITSINYKYTANKEKLEELNNEILTLSTSNTGSEAKIEEIKAKLNDVNKMFEDKQKELLDVTTKVEKLKAEKQIVTEKQKMNTSDAKLHDSLLELKEKELTLENSLSKVSSENIELERSIAKTISNLEEKNKKIDDIKNNKNKLNSDLENVVRSNNYLKLKIEQLSESIENNSLLPFAVKKVLSNPKLKGIHNTVGNLIDIDEAYVTAITTSLGASFSNIVVDNETVAKEIINYLKLNSIGRVTLYPLNIMKEKYVDDDVLNSIKKEKGFIDVASNLVKCDSIYNNIIKNLLGNVVVVDAIDNANRISKIINYRYKVVTLDGEVLNVGGSITGGKQAQTRNIISDKYELEKLMHEKEENTNKIKNFEEKINNIDKDYKAVEDEIYLISKEKIELEEKYNNKLINEENIKNELEDVRNNIKNTDNLINNTISIAEQKIVDSYYEELNKKDFINIDIECLIKDKKDLNDELEELEFERRRENSLFNSKNKELKDLEIEINRMDVKLDNLLSRLSEEYSMSYEKAVSNYKLEIDPDVARNEVNSLKNKIKAIGPVNTDAPEEYAKVSGRYEFLNKQREDLVNAENTLLGIIDELDEVMIKEFTENFNVIRENFMQTFKELFKGGTADLKLLEPDNILESGIDIVASPPGKKLTTISLLSGGEKTFTAISLVFAILKSRPVPFCIFDEVEAALDEANVDSFGKYLKNLTSKTQFILITHKKKTMEYADVLYGITMQESGVSKLVSVKLEEIEK